MSKMYSQNEEQANIWTHAIGIPLALALIFILQKSETTNEELKWASLLFSFTLLFMFLTSTIYHAVIDSSKKARFRTLDHIAIFFLIAGTYSPFIIWDQQLNEKSSIFLIIVWILAVIGSVYKLFSKKKVKWLSAAIYIGMGWLVVLFGKSLLTELDKSILYPLVLGGLFYTLGTLFYVRKNMNYHHAIWHVFVLIAAILHAYSVYRLLNWDQLVLNS